MYIQGVLLKWRRVLIIFILVSNDFQYILNLYLEGQENLLNDSLKNIWYFQGIVNNLFSTYVRNTDFLSIISYAFQCVQMMNHEQHDTCLLHLYVTI